ncbi:uncharacterized protein LOC129227065 [Uloborus diversus]|uniref:uncharacterized protein LOC129227065 n=1 Tax=Uloborus diversus TaxID=327109 RepID=UPI00240920C5|nr:uncharacterized protein LOC129227065 [Uloborus diversus]
MDTRHDLTVDHARLLANSNGYATMDNSATGHPNSQQLRPPYGDLCRPPGSDASTLAYHSRYLASMPLTTGSSFPFLGNMFTGSLPGPPTSPFRSPSTPAVNNMRQFWPPTPPPDGYNRYSMNANLFPLFGTPTADNGAFLTQGLVSRLGSTTHLSPLIDHKEHSFFSHGIGLGSPLTPTSHVASPSPYPHLIPSLERHPAFNGHMPMSNKELEDLQQEMDNAHLLKSQLDCLMKHDIPSSRQDRPKSKMDSKHCCDKLSDDCCKLSPSCIPRDGLKVHEDIRKCDGKNHSRQPTNKVHPCKIEVSHSPALKPDLLSPPIESPKSEVGSPCKNSKKPSVSPFASDSSSPITSMGQYENSSETRCCQCSASMKGIGIATKLNSENKAELSSVSESFCGQNHSPVVTSASTSANNPVTNVNAVVPNQSQVASANVEAKHCYQKSSSDSPTITITDTSDKTLEQSCISNRNCAENLSKPITNSSVGIKHVTAAVIPTAPKQAVLRDVHPETNCLSSVQDQSKVLANSEHLSNSSEINQTFSERQNVKLEMSDSPSLSEKNMSQNPIPTAVASSYPNKIANKSLSTSCKVKDIIKNSCPLKQTPTDRLQDVLPLKVTESDTCNRMLMPNSPSNLSSCVTTTTASPTIMAKSPTKPGKGQFVPIEAARKCSPFKEDAPVMKAELANRLDCEFSQKSNNWSKATVMPFNWQNNAHDDQAINLTVTKKIVKPEPSELITSHAQEITQSSMKLSSESTLLTNAGVIGICHPNPSPIAMGKVKTAPAVSSISNFSAISVLNQPTEQTTAEVHILRASKSSFPVVSRNATPPAPLKSTISHVTSNTSIRAVKAERLMTKRGKLSEIEKVGHNGRSTLATLAPKLSKSRSFGKDVQTSHTLSAASSVSSTSIVFPATVNPCIPVGIAIAQQRQDSSTATSIGKSQATVPSSTSNVISNNSHLASSRVATEIQPQELIRDQKSQDLSCSNNPTPVDANLLVTQGPTIVSRQWESEALTRTAMPSPWVAHGSIVAPAVWLGQGAYAATTAPTSNNVPSVAMNPLDSSPISLPPGGYQLARDSITGHLLLIPTANIELMDRPSVWPSFNSSTGNLPIQQLVTQQQHTQFEQVIPQTDSLKTSEGIENSCSITTCDLSSTPVKGEDKVEDVSGQVPSVPLAHGQTYAFATFPTQCDPSSFSYVLQSSTVMHLAHTQTTASIQTESGRRSQGTSPLHCATPSPPPNTCSIQVSVTEDEEESDNDGEGVACSESTEVQLSCQNQSVTMAIQVDMDSQTNSEEEEEEERKSVPEKVEELKIEMSDSANQTDSLHSESPKSEVETEDIGECLLSFSSNQNNGQVETVKPVMEVIPESKKSQVTEQPPAASAESVKEANAELEIMTSETELAPSLPVESKPVMDFIDHHGLNLLVDSIEEFASREQESHDKENIDVKTTTENSKQTSEEKKDDASSQQCETGKVLSGRVPEKPFVPTYKTIDTSCTDGLGLLCALAEQRFFEEALNDDNKAKTTADEKPDCYNFEEENDCSQSGSCPTNDQMELSSSNSSSQHSSRSSSPDHREATELEMRLRLAELQKKYRQKQRELELLRKSKEKENDDDSSAEKISKSKKSLPTNRNPSTTSHSKSSQNGHTLFVKNSVSKPSQRKPSKISDAVKKMCNGSTVSQKPEVSEDKDSFKEGKTQEYNGDECNKKVPSITLAHGPKVSPPCSDSNASSSSLDSSTEPCNKKANKKFKSGNISESESSNKEDGNFNYDKAWFVRRSERIFLSDARTVATPQQAASSNTPDKNAKKAASNVPQKPTSEQPQKEKKEVSKPKTPKSTDESDGKKGKNKDNSKSKLVLPKKRSYSESCDSSCDAGSGSDSENSDGASSINENVPLSKFVEHKNNTKASMSERHKRLSTDSACSDLSSGQSEDIPLSVLIGQSSKPPEMKSCTLKPEDLQETARLLVLDEGLFYAGNITKSENPDMYGILIDGDRAARPHMFSKEEILNAAVLEVKPTQKQQLPEGSRICAFWSQQYRCLYPGTVVNKVSSPDQDPSMLYVEFDDGDSGKIPLNDIRMLPPDFPIVSMEPNPFMILGKRRARAQSQNSTCATDVKNTDATNQKTDKDKNENKKHKSHDKLNKKNPDEKNSKEGSCKSKLPNTSNRSSSKSSTSATEVRSQSSGPKKDTGEDKKKSSDKSQTLSVKSKDTENASSEASGSKPKKHKKHKEDHHKHHHHHHHKHHHHKKHKIEKERRHSSDDAVISASSSTMSEDSSNCLSSTSSKGADQDQNTFILENSKSELTVKIKKSPSPHTTPEDSAAQVATTNGKVSNSGSSEDETNSSENSKKKPKRSKQQTTQNKPAKRKDRLPSVEKSKIAAFLPVRQLWRWSGKSFRRPGAKGKAKKEFYRSIQRGKETIRVGDCAVFLSTGRPHLPYIGRIETMWESWGGKMDVKVKWFYHPEETKSGKKLSQLKGALFQSPHFDENDVQTISHKCEVLSWEAYQEKRHPENKYGSLFDNNDTYFLAGTYDPIMGTLILEPGVPSLTSNTIPEV